MYQVHLRRLKMTCLGRLSGGTVLYLGKEVLHLRYPLEKPILKPPNIWQARLSATNEVSVPNNTSLLALKLN